MCLEMVGSRWRAILAVGLMEGGWVLGQYQIVIVIAMSVTLPSPGYLSLAGIAYAIPDAFYLQIVVALGILPFR